jgi:hypothetical protein
MHRPLRSPLALALLLLFAALPAAAQQLEIGVHGGLARSNEITSGVMICQEGGAGSCGPTSFNPHYWRHAPTFGLLLRQQTSPALGLRGELNLAHRGYGPGAQSADHVAALYLETPLLAELRLLRRGMLEVQLAGGLAPALLLSCRFTGRDVNGPVDARCDEVSPWGGESYGPTSRYDVGAVLAPGLRLRTAGGSLGLEHRFSHGLVDIRPTGRGITTHRSHVTAITFSRSLGHPTP